MTVEQLTLKEAIESETFYNNLNDEYHLHQLVTPEDCRHAKDQLATQLNIDLAGQDVVYLILDNGATRYAKYVQNRIATFIYTEKHLSVSSYGNGTETSGKVNYDQQQLISLLQPDKPLLIMEDIIDSGTTLQELTDFINNLRPDQQPKKIIICTLFDKPARRGPRITIKPDYVGMVLEDVFIVGEGLDYQEKHREIDGLYEVVFY